MTSFDRMEEKYLIEISNRQTIDGETEVISLTTKGSYVEKNGKRYIIYREYDQDTHEERTTTLKVDPTGRHRTVSLIRRGDDNRGTNLLLEQGQRHLCQYGTAFGSITLGVFTSRISDHLSENGGRLSVEYTLDVNTNLSSTNAITVSVTPFSAG